MTFASIVDWGKLVEAAYVSAIFGLGIMLIGGVAVVSNLRSQDMKSDSRGSGAMALDVVTGICVLAIVAAVVFGIHIMAQK